MQADEFPPVIEFMTATWTASERWPDSTWDLWFEELSRFTPQEVIAALRDLTIEHEKFPPAWPRVLASCSATRRRSDRQAAIRQGAEDGQW